MNLLDHYGITEAEFIDKKDKFYEYPLTNIIYHDVPISIYVGLDDENGEESLKHIYEDFNAILSEGIEKIIKEKFIFWLNENAFTENDEKLYEGLKLYSIVYSYHRIVNEYSPTGKEGYFGEFEFAFEAGNEFAESILEASSIEVYVQNGKVVGTKCYDI